MADIRVVIRAIAGLKLRNDLVSATDRTMNSVIDKALDRTAARMEDEFETITPFRWNYYATLLIAMMFFSSLAVHYCGSVEKTAESIRSAPHAAVKCLNQLNGLVSKFR
jgi:hypothetical protein